jgi:hypothetical protein
LIGFGELEVFVESCVGVVKGDDKAFGAAKNAPFEEVTTKKGV